jgi:hypothetical protein
MNKKHKEEQIKVFNTEITEAADDLLEAHKAFVDAKDRVEVCRKFLAGLMKGTGLSNGQYINHDGHKLCLKEYDVKDDTIVIKKSKD